MFFQYPLTDSFKERAINYSAIIAIITLIFHVISIITGDGLQTYFDVAIGSDFLAFYTGGSFFNQGILEKVYEFERGIYFPEQFEFQRDLIGQDYIDHSPFINPPYTALFYAPFALLDYVPAYILWVIFNLIVLAICVRLIHRELPYFHNISIHKLYLCSFLFFPTIANFLYGQATPIVLLCYCLCYTSLRKHRDFRAGFYLGLLAFKPQLAVGIALVLLIKWRWRSLLGGILSVSLSVGAGFLLMPDAMQAYLEISPKLLGILRAPDYPTWGITSFFGFSALLFDNLNPKISDISTFLLTAITILLLIMLWRKVNWLKDKVLWDLSMAVTFCWGLLISPHLFFYDLMLLLLPAAIMIQHLPWIYERNNKIILWTTLVWAISYLGNNISNAQLETLSYFNLIEISLQLSTPIIFYWGYCIYKTVQNEQQTRLSSRL